MTQSSESGAERLALLRKLLHAQEERAKAYAELHSSAPSPLSSDATMANSLLRTGAT